LLLVNGALLQAQTARQPTPSGLQQLGGQLAPLFQYDAPRHHALSYDLYGLLLNRLQLGYERAFNPYMSYYLSPYLGFRRGEFFYYTGTDPFQVGASGQGRIFPGGRAPFGGYLGLHLDGRYFAHRLCESGNQACGPGNRRRYHKAAFAFAFLAGFKTQLIQASFLEMYCTAGHQLPFSTGDRREFAHVPEGFGRALERMHFRIGLCIGGVLGGMSEAAFRRYYNRHPFHY
jgi:hypothetical protein